jgi:hypothetical protein
MSAQLGHQGTLPRSGTGAPSRATLRTRPLHQRILIRYWEYIPAFRFAILMLRLLAVVVLVTSSIAIFSISVGWGLFLLAMACAVLPFSLWVYGTASRGWPVR